MRSAGIVVGLLGFAVFVDGSFALTQQIENLAKVDVAPGFGPFVRRLGNILQAFAESVRGSLIILLIEESFAHAKIGKRAARLDAERSLILSDGVVELALLGEIFAAGNGGAGAERGAGFKNDIVGIDLDSAGLRPAKRLDREPGFRADDVDGFLLRISFRVDAQIHWHTKRVQGLLDLANDAKSLRCAVHDVFQRELRHTVTPQNFGECSRGPRVLRGVWCFLFREFA